MSIGQRNIISESVKRTFLWFRFKPFETSTSLERANERHRRLLLTVLASLVAKVISIITIVISVPLTVDYLGVERYGLWVTISSLIAMLGFADLGMGNGLMNAISEANGKDDRVLAQEYVSNGFFMLLVISLLLAIIFMVLFPTIAWASIFNVKSTQAISEIGAVIFICVICFLLSLPLGVIVRVQMGYQEGFSNSVWSGVGNLLGLVGVLSVVYFRGGLPLLVLAMAGTPIVATLLNGVMLFGVKKPWLRPSIKYLRRSVALRIFNLGILFFVLQIAMALAYTSDNVIAAQVLGPEAVAQYSIPMRMFSIPPMILTMALSALWPAYGEAINRGDVVWIKQTLLRSLIITALFTGLLSLPMIGFGSQIIRLWVGPTIRPPFLLLLGFGVWMIVGSLGNAVAMFFNGLHIVRFQVYTALSMAVSNLLLSVYLAQRIGLPGIIWGTVVTYTVFSVIPTIIYLPRFLRDMCKDKNISYDC